MPYTTPIRKGILGLRLSPRAVQTQALCLDQFFWMDNAKGQSPCLVAAYLLAQCSAGEWTVPSIGNASNHYTPPTTQTANRCQCSWSVYNLLQACAYCQGQDYTSAIFGWNGWNTNCTNFFTAPDPYPNDVQIPGATGIPYYATMDPSSWENAIFDPAFAQRIASENHPDLTQESRAAQSSGGSNTGAIAGGVAAGVVVLLLALGAFIFFRRRRARRILLADNQTTMGTIKSTSSTPFSWSSHGIWSRYRIGGKEMTDVQTTTTQSLLSSSPSMMSSPSPVSAMTGSSGVGGMGIGNGSFANATIGSLSGFTGSVTHVNSSQVPTMGHGHVPSGSITSVQFAPGQGPGQTLFAPRHGHSLSQTSSLTTSSAFHSPSDTSSANPLITPYLLPSMPTVPELHDANEDEHSKARAAGSVGATVSSSGVLMDTPIHKERQRLNPPAYTPISSPEERYFASIAPGAVRDQVEVANAGEATAGTGMASASVTGTVVGSDAGHVGHHAPSETGAESSVGGSENANTNTARSTANEETRYGFPVDRKR